MAYWNISFNHLLNMKDLELVKLLTSIYNYRDILKDIPVGNGLKSEFLPNGKDRNKIQGGTVKSDMILSDIKGTTGIEGNTLNESEIADVLGSNAAKNRQEQEVLNIRKVHEFIQKTVPAGGNIIITKELCQQLNEIVMNEVTEGDEIPGKYRLYNVKVDKSHIPTRFEEIPSKMDGFFEIINSPEMLSYDPLLRAVVAHFYLVSIHPFGNGNGRTSRALESYIFYHTGMQVQGFYSLSNFYYRNYFEYCTMLDDARFKYNGCLQEFVKFALKGYLYEFQILSEKIKSFTILKGFENFVLELLKKDEITNRQFLVIQYLFQNNGIYKKQQLLKCVDAHFKSIYDGIKAKKTIERDLANLERHNLICIDDDDCYKLNLNVMRQFT